MKQILEQRTNKTYLQRRNFSLPFSERRLLLFAGDAFCLGLAIITGYTVQSQMARTLGQEANAFGGQLFWLVILSAVWFGLALVNETYDMQVAHRRLSILQAIFFTLVETGIFYLFLFFVLSRPMYMGVPFWGNVWQIGFLDTPPRVVALVFFLIATVTIISWRLVYIVLFTRTSFQTRAIIVGAGWAGSSLVQALRGATTPYEVIGFVDDDPEKQGTTIKGVPVLGNSGDLLDLVRHEHIDEVILAVTDEIQERLFRALVDCYEGGIQIRPMPLVYEEVLNRVPVEHLGQKWLSPSFWNNPKTSGLYRFSKRSLDLLLGCIGLLAFLVLLPVLAIVIYVDSPGPIFYTQERLGKGKLSFRVIKLRSMIPDAEKGQARWAARDDDRITRVGKLLRRTRLDELPQVLNVLRGDMSIVGPRPERPEFIYQLEEQIPFYRTRLSVKPGLTGWAQIRYRYGNSVEDALIKLQYDLYYIKHQSILIDVLIILRTLRVMLLLQGT